MIGPIVKGDFAGFVIALAWLECIITIGRHPWFKHWNIYVLMVFTVFWEFGKILFYYSFFIITAGLGFYVHLHSRYTYLFSNDKINFSISYLKKFEFNFCHDVLNVWWKFFYRIPPNSTPKPQEDLRENDELKSIHLKLNQIISNQEDNENDIFDDSISTSFLKNFIMFTGENVWKSSHFF